MAFSSHFFQINLKNISAFRQALRDNKDISGTIFMQEVVKMPNLKELIGKDINPHAPSLTNSLYRSTSNALISIFKEYENLLKDSEGKYYAKQRGLIVEDFNIIQQNKPDPKEQLRFLYLSLFHTTFLAILQSKSLETLKNVDDYFEKSANLSRRRVCQEIKSILLSDYHSIIHPSASKVLLFTQMKVLIKGFELKTAALLQDLKKDSESFGILVQADTLMVGSQPSKEEFISPGIKTNLLRIREILKSTGGLTSKHLEKAASILSSTQEKLGQCTKEALQLVSSNTTQLKISHRLNLFVNTPRNEFDFFPGQPLELTLQKMFRTNEAFSNHLNQLGRVGWLVMDRYQREYEYVSITQFKDFIKNLASNLPTLLPKTKVFLEFAVVSNINFTDLNFLIHNRQYLEAIPKYDLSSLVFLFRQFDQETPIISQYSIDDFKKALAGNINRSLLSNEFETLIMDNLKRVSLKNSQILVDIGARIIIPCLCTILNAIAIQHSNSEQANEWSSEVTIMPRR